jgi:hypothetical protein
MVFHLSGDLLATESERPIAASSMAMSGWHACGLLASVTVTSRARGRSSFVVVKRHKRDARELQIRHALLPFCLHPVTARCFCRSGACASTTCAWADGVPGSVAIKGKDPMTPQL